MNAYAAIGSLSVRTADLGDAASVARIDRFLQAHPGATPFHRPQWNRAIAAAMGHRAHFLLAEQAGTLVGLLPLTEIRSRLFGAALVSAGFGVSGGILAYDQEAATVLTDAAERLAQARRCPSVELRGGTLPPFWRTSANVYAGFARDLPPGEEAILKSIPRKQRAEVRKALAHELRVDVGRGLDAHYRVYSESVRNLGTPVFPRSLFRAVLAEFGDDADILVISRGGKPLSAVLSLYMKNCVYPYWGGGTAEARGARANELLYFELMKHAAGDKGCTRFDFGRSKLGTGAYSYKKNWGFDPEPLIYASWGEPREINPMSPKYRLQVAAWQKLPLWAANLVGPPVARGLG